MNFNGCEIIDYEAEKHKLRSAKLAPDGVDDFIQSVRDFLAEPVISS